MSANEILRSSKKFHISLGLDRVKRVLEILDNPQEKYKCFHIAGTNGKGSTSKIINDILVENFKNTDTKIGLFTSPHLFSYTERIKINNQDIPNADFDELISFIDSTAKKNNIELTEFELLTVCAFYYFYKNNVKYVVLEVGLGGALDATNIIKKPVSCIITTIDYDHTERLGKTIEEIALQKAGIIKEDSKVIINKSNKAYNVIEKITKEKNSEIISIPDVKITKENNENYATVNYKNNIQKYKFNLLGSHQSENLSLALGAILSSGIKTENNAIKNALSKINWKFRLEYNKNKNLLIDGAHNPSGIKTLKKYIAENYSNEKKTFIFGCLKNKDYLKMLDILIDKDDEFYFFEFNYPNALKYSELQKQYRGNVIKVNSTEEIDEIIKTKKNIKIVCGSLYMLGLLGKILN